MKSPRDVLDIIDNDLNVSFYHEWVSDAVDASGRDQPGFRPILDIIRQAFEPHKERVGYHYRFFIAGRYCPQVGNIYVPKRITPLLDATAGVSTALPPKITFSMRPVPDPEAAFVPDPNVSSIPCSTCHGLGSNGVAELGKSGVPPRIIEMHAAMASALKSPHLKPRRSHRWRIMVSTLQTAEDSKVALPDPGIYQILFGGKVYGFGAAPAHRPALMHYLDAWNLTVNPYFYHEEEDAPVQKLGIDPNNPNEYIEHPWRKPCEVCLGEGSLPKK